jgi:hypothetical protein
MTLDQIVQAAYSIYEGDADTPASGEDEYTLATRYSNAAINMWYREGGMLWNELWVKLEDAATGDKTTADGTLVYDCPTDFHFPGGHVRLVDAAGVSKYFSVITQEKSQLFDQLSDSVCWFTGNPQDGYDLNFLNDPDGTYTISYEYYKTPTELSATSDVPEMTDPYFIVWYVVWRLYKNDGQHDESNEAKDIWIGKLSQMKDQNIMPAWYQDNRIEDRNFDTGGSGFGV